MADKLPQIPRIPASALMDAKIERSLERIPLSAGDGDDEEVVILGRTKEEKEASRKRRYDRIGSKQYVHQTLMRIVKNRIALMDRYNGMALFRDPRNIWEGDNRRSDTPQFQTLWQLKKIYLEADGIEKLGERLRIQADVLKQIGSICDRVEDENRRIHEELKSIDAALNDDESDPEKQLEKLLGGAVRNAETA